MNTRTALPMLQIPFLIALAGVASSQGTVWVVDDDLGPNVDFQEIQAAVDAASDFDLVLVHEGVYSSVQIVDKQLTVVADGLATIESFSSDVFGSDPVPLSISGLSASKSVVVRGVTLSTLVVGDGDQTALSVSACDGPVLLENCDITTTVGSAAFLGDNASVTFSRCLVDAGATEYDSYGDFYIDHPGIWSQSTDLYLFDSEVQGSRGRESQAGLFDDFAPGNGGVGILMDGTLTTQGSTIRGGDGGSVVPGTCFAGADGGAGVVFGGATTLRLQDTLVAAGAGGVTTPGCPEPDGVAGIALNGDPALVEQLPGASRSFSWHSPVVGGNPIETTFEAEPGDFAVLLAGVFIGLDDVSLGLPLLLGSSYFVIPLVSLPSGDLQLNFAAPTLGGTNDFAQISAQVAYIDASSDVFVSGLSVVDILDQNQF